MRANPVFLIVCFVLAACASGQALPARKRVQTVPAAEVASFDMSLLRPNMRVPMNVVASIERELISRELKQHLKGTDLEKLIVLDPGLAHLSTPDLVSIQQRSGNYGGESREPALATPRAADVEANILATAVMVNEKFITHLKPGWEMKDLLTLMESERVCACEPFATLPAPGFCTAFLVDKKTLATTYHCVDLDPDLKHTYFVFGFHQRADGTVQTNFAENEVLTGSVCVDGSGFPKANAAADYAYVCLDSDPPADRHPVKWRMSGKVTDNQKIYVVGYPSGLPVTFASDANVVENNPNSYFICNLDTYRGNSGSPVFNETTNDLEGMLLRGEVDFVPAGDCQISKKCPMNLGDCTGEDVLRVTLMQLPP